MSEVMQEQEPVGKTDPQAQSAAQVVAFGKFADAEQLFKAYRSLESEFTKRCQELKAAQATILAHEDERKKLEDRLQNIFEEEDFVGRAAADARVVHTVIRQYLLACAAQKEGVKLLTGGVGVTALPPPQKPKTLEEAMALAKKLLK